MAKQDKEPDADDRPGYNGPKTDSIPVVKKNAPNKKTPQSYQTGNRVYNGASNSPHSGGGLNKGGFAQRDNEAAAKKAFMLKQLQQGGGF